MGILKKKSLAKSITLSLITAAVYTGFTISAYAAPMPMPTGGTINQGTFKNFDGNPTGTTATITQTSNRGVIDWASFDVAAGRTLNFVQPDVASMTLNRVTGNSLSTIAGNINANGSIAIINPNGLFFAAGSTVNAAGILASTSELNVNDFMNGTLTFEQNAATNANVIVNGTLNAETNNAAVNSVLNLGGVKPVTGFSTMNNVVRIVADGNVTVGEAGKITAVTTTSVTKADGTIGQESYTIDDSSTTSAVGRIVIRADENADDLGTVVLNNTNANQIQSNNVSIYYNPNITSLGINGTSSANITGDPADTNNYTQKDYTDYANQAEVYKSKIADSITQKVTDLTTGANVDQPTTSATSKNVYMLVNDIYQLAAIEDAAYGNLAGSYAQGKNIDASATATWNEGRGFHPIGSTSEAETATKEGPFKGGFSGNGGTTQYTLNNLNINRPTEDNVGLFSVVSGSIANIRLAGDTNITGNDNLGAIVGLLEDSGSVLWSSTSSSVTVTGVDNESDIASGIGGLVGKSNGGTVAGSANGAKVLAITADNVGGVVGEATDNTKLSSVYNTGEVKGLNNVGGIAGSLNTGTTMSGAINAGKITGTENTGGLAGNSTGSTISGSHNKGEIYGVVNTGGLVGYADKSTFSKVYNTNENTTLDSAISEGSAAATTLSTYGKVTGTTNTGGLVGHLVNSDIETAYNAGNVTGTGDNTGGLVGLMESGSIKYAYNADNNTVLYKTGLLNGGVADIANDDYNGFTYNGVAYTYSEATNLYTNTKTGDTYSIAAMAVTAPTSARVYNVRLAYRDANVTGANNTGGLVGQLTGGTVSKAYNAGAVTGTEGTTGAIGGNVASGTSVSNAYYVTSNKDNTKNLSNQTTAFGVNDSGAAISGITLAEAQSSPGNIILWGNNVNRDDGNNWITYETETTPLLQAFMNNISIDREYNYDGTYRSLKSEDVTNLYGGAFFNGLSGDGKNVLSGTMTDSVAAYGSGNGKVQATDNSGNKLYYQADNSVSTVVTGRPAYWLYERAKNANGITYSIYTYDTSNLWSPQHGYLTSKNATVVIDPVQLTVSISGSKVYGQAAVTGATSETTAGTTYDTGYKITYAGLAGGETAGNVLTGTITYDGMGQASIVYKKGATTDNAQLNAGTYTFDSSKFDSTTLIANNNNYTISYAGTLNVAKANLYINVDGSRVYGNNNSTAAYKYTAGTGSDNNANDGTLKTWDSTSATDLTTLTGWSHNTINNLNSATTVTHNGTAAGKAIVAGTDVKGTSAAPTAYNLANGGDLSSGRSTNYTIVFDTTKGSTGNFTITPATIHYTVAGQRTYGDDNDTATGSVTAVASSLKANDKQTDVLDVTSSTAIAQWMAGTKYGLNKTTNAGSYSDQTLTASDASTQGINIKSGNNNYLLADKADSFNFTINKAALTFAVDAQSKIYGQNNPTLTGDTGTGWKNNESLSNVNDNGTYSNPAITMGYSTEATQQSDAGTYTEGIKVAEATKTAINATTLDENYAIAYKKNDLVITKADLDFAATGSSTYGSAPAIGDVKLTSATAAYTNAGDSVNNDEHKLKSWDASAVANIKTLKGFTSTNPITLYTTINGVKTKIGTVTNVVRDSSGNVTAYALADGSFFDANGNCQLTTKNYNLHFIADGSSLTVNPKGLTFNVADTSRTYGTTSNTVGSGSNLTGLVNGDVITISADGSYSYNLKDNGPLAKTGNDTLIYTTDKNTATTNAGTYKDAINVTDVSKTTLDDYLNNYSISTVNKGDMNVNKANLTFVVNDSSKTYGDANKTLTGYFDTTTNGFKNGDTVTVNSTTGAVTAVSLNDNGTTVTNVSAAGSLAYDGAAITTKTNAGTYTDALGASGLDLTNYKVNYVAGDMTVNKADLTFVADSKTKTYGDANPVLTGHFDTTTNGFKNGDTVTVDSTTGAVTAVSLNDNGTTVTNVSAAGNLAYDGSAITKKTNVGIYNDVLSASGLDLTNYKVNYVTGDMTVNKADLTFVADSKTKTYGDANPVLTGHFDTTTNGFKNGDTVTVNSTTGAVTAVSLNDNGTTVTNVSAAGNLAYDGSAINTKTNAGTYTDALGASGLDLANYKVNYVAGDMTVNKADLTFVVNDSSKTYGDANKTLTGYFDTTTNGFKNGDTVTVNSTTGAVTAVSLNDNGTTVTNVSAAGSLAYDGSAITTKTNAGTYTDALGASGLDLTNYKVNYVAGDMTVDKAKVTFVVDSKNKTYGDKNPDLTGSFDTTVSGFKNGDEINLGTDGKISSIKLNDNGQASITDKSSSQVSGFNITTDAAQYSNVDNYNIIGTGFALTNYDVVYKQNILTINKAPLIYTVDDLTKIYGENPSYTGAYSGLKGSNDTNVLGGLTPSITGAVQTSSVGTYDLTANFADIIGQFSNYDLTTNAGKLTITPANLNFTANGGRDYGVDSNVNDFTYTPNKGVSESAESSTTNDGKLKAWDSSSAGNLSTLEGFGKNGTDALILWTTDKNGNRAQIGKVTSVKFDSNNNIVGYELLDGSFTRDNNTCQLGSLNYNWIFTGGSYKISELPVPGETPYQTAIRDSNSIGGYRTVQDKTSILFLRVIDNGINVAGDSLNLDDVLKYTI